jgi:hypothetical protein
LGCEGFTFWVARAKAWAPVTVVVEVVVVVVVDVLIDVAWALLMSQPMCRATVVFKNGALVSATLASSRAA